MNGIRGPNFNRRRLNATASGSVAPFAAPAAGQTFVVLGRDDIHDSPGNRKYARAASVVISRVEAARAGLNQG